MLSDCWHVTGPACHPYFDDCDIQQQHLWSLMVFSNAVYLAPVGTLIIVRKWSHKHNISAADIQFIIIHLLLMFASAFYHACDDANSTIRCYNKCIIGWEKLYTTDRLLSGMVVMTCALFGWQTTNFYRNLYKSSILIVFPYIALYVMDLQPWAMIIFTVVVAAVTIGIRIQSCELRLKEYQTFVLLAMTLSFVGLAIILNYTEEIHDSPIGVSHSSWHAATSMADLLVPFMFKPTSENIADDGHQYVILNSGRSLDKKTGFTGLKATADRAIQKYLF